MPHYQMLLLSFLISFSCFVTKFHTNAVLLLNDILKMSDAHFIVSTTTTTTTTTKKRERERRKKKKKKKEKERERETEHV
jgi:hypothetical protein